MDLDLLSHIQKLQELINLLKTQVEEDKENSEESNDNTLDENNLVDNNIINDILYNETSE